ncbi:zinc finger CCHC domain-containing protein 12-like [Tachysurus ichikawai]
MRSHLGMTKPGLHLFKSRATVHQLTTNATEVGAGAAADVDPVKKQIAEIHAQLVPLKFRVHKQGQTDVPETAGISMLKEEINELRAQVKAIGSAITKKNNHCDSGVSELAGLRKQVAELKAQLAITGAQKSQTQKLLGSHGDFEKAQPKQTELNKCGQSNLSGVVSARPRPGYCFNCGEDGHIVAHCKKDPNPLEVDRKRLFLREKQAHWDSQNHVVPQQLNSKPTLY